MFILYYYCYFMSMFILCMVDVVKRNVHLHVWTCMQCWTFRFRGGLDKHLLEFIQSGLYLEYHTCGHPWTRSRGTQVSKENHASPVDLASCKLKSGAVPHLVKRCTKSKDRQTHTHSCAHHLETCKSDHYILGIEQCLFAQNTK